MYLYLGKIGLDLNIKEAKPSFPVRHQHSFCELIIAAFSSMFIGTRGVCLWAFSSQKMTHFRLLPSKRVWQNFDGPGSRHALLLLYNPVTMVLPP
jgi:hypothetical protein